MRSGDSANGADRRLSAQRELARLVQLWRARLPDHPSQEQLAAEAGVSWSWYGALERGQMRHFSDDMIERVATALRCRDVERDLLFRLACGHPALERARYQFQLTAGREIDVLSRPLPTYISDAAWDVALANRAMRLWFPWIGEDETQGRCPNIMLWVFTAAEARFQLHPWRSVWAPLMLAQMKTAWTRQPGNARLREVIERVLASEPYARRLWDDREPYEHPDGDRRYVRLPFYAHRLVEIEIDAADPLSEPHTRVMSLVPLEAGDRRELYGRLCVCGRGSECICGGAEMLASAL